MAGIARTAASLRITGDDLDPAEISLLLRAEPTRGERKGDVRRSGFVTKAGVWLLRTPERTPGDLESQILEMLSHVTDNLSVWKTLGQHFRVDLYCGLFMDGSNEGLSLSPRLHGALSERGIELHLDLYGPDLPHNQAIAVWPD